MIERISSTMDGTAGSVAIRLGEVAIRGSVGFEFYFILKNYNASMSMIYMLAWEHMLPSL